MAFCCSIGGSKISKSYTSSVLVDGMADPLSLIYINAFEPIIQIDYIQIFDLVFCIKSSVYNKKRKLC